MSRIPPHWQRDVALQHANTLQLPSVAEYFLASADAAVLTAAALDARRLGLPWRVLGGGSNAVLMPQVPGLILHPAETAWRISEEGRLRVGAGMDWALLVEQVCSKGWWGIENLALIPGQVGAAPIQNIGAYGADLADVCHSVQALDVQTAQLVELAAESCGFGYRDSLFRRHPQRFLILQVTLQLRRAGAPRLDYPDLAELWRVRSETEAGATPSGVAAAVSALRRRKLPDVTQLPNAGSFFKNPTLDAAAADRLLAKAPDAPLRGVADGFKLSAAWLIERCGLRGHRDGAFGMSEQHALVLVHFGGGDAAGLLAFADTVRDRVHARFGVDLEMEPRLLGTEAASG